MKAKMLMAAWWLGLFGVLWLVGFKNLDPDFGWHLRVGELMLTQGIPRTDPFSYTMPSFMWVDHGRLSDVMIAWLYPRIGMGGLAAVFAAIATLAVMIAIPVSVWSWGLVPLLMGVGVFLVRFGVRPQVEDWLFVAILIRVMEEGRWKRWKWIMPVIFAVWANFHGGFAVGLGILGVRIVGGWWEERLVEWKETWVWLAAAGATLLNPYGWRLWQEIWLTTSDVGLRSTIAEWQPFWVRAELGFWLVVALVWALIKVYGGGLKKWKWGVVGLLLAASLSSLRNAPFFILVVIPIVAEKLKTGYERVRKDRIMLDRAKKFYLILVAVAAVVFVEEAGITVWRAAKGKWVWYPEKAVEFLKTNSFEGKLFSNYGWGGYLIWKLPEKKVFIDGRMPSWRWIAPSGESNWAFKDYRKISDEGEFEELFGKFGVEAVLWPKGGEAGIQRPVVDLAETWWWKKFFGGKPQKELIDKLEDQGWKKVYEDEGVVVLNRPK